MSNPNDLNIAALVELAAVKGQLQTMTQMMQNNHDATHRRMEDMQRANEQRFDTIDERLSVVEANERGTALRTAGLAAVTSAGVSAVVAAGMALLKFPK